MTRRRDVWLLVGIGLAAVVVGVVLLRMELDNADKTASVIGAIVGVLGLGATVYGVVLTRRASAPPSGGQSVTDSTIHGPNIQIGAIGGDAVIEPPK